MGKFTAMTTKMSGYFGKVQIMKKKAPYIKYTYNRFVIYNHLSKWCRTKTAISTDDEAIDRRVA